MMFTGQDIVSERYIIQMTQIIQNPSLTVKLREMSVYNKTSTGWTGFINL